MDRIKFTIEGSIAKITLNAPERLNAFDKQMAFDMQACLDKCKDSNIRVVVITGEGKGFCAGQFLGELIGENAPGFETILRDHYNPIIEKITQLQKPVVALVNGTAAGAGANIALSCDIVLAKSSSKFLQAFANIGLIPDSGGTYFLPRLVGFQKAMGLAMLADTITAVQAEQMGMIYKAIDDEVFDDEAEKIIIKLSNMPTKGLSLIKKAMQLSLQNNLSEQLAVEDKLQYEAAHTKDYNEGVAAFLEKRKPNFIGA